MSPVSWSMPPPADASTRPRKGVRSRCEEATDPGFAAVTPYFLSTIPKPISSELARSSGAYIACAFAGNAANLPGISARSRYETELVPRGSARTKNYTCASRSSMYAHRFP